MAIKVTTPETKQDVKPFPKLMKNQDGEIFYMVREKYGLPLSGDEWDFRENNFADFYDTPHIFTDYNEPITIQNA